MDDAFARSFVRSLARSFRRRRRRRESTGNLTTDRRVDLRGVASSVIRRHPSIRRSTPGRRDACIPIKHTHTANETHTTNDDMHSPIHRSRPTSSPPPLLPPPGARAAPHPSSSIHPSILGRSVRISTRVYGITRPQSTRPNARWTRVPVVPSSLIRARADTLRTPREMSTTTTVRASLELAMRSRVVVASRRRRVEGRMRAHPPFGASRGGDARGWARFW